MPLRMNGTIILNIRDLKKHFSLQDALRSHMEFAAFAMRHAACMDDVSRVMAILFALYSLRQRQRMMELDVKTIPGIRNPEALRKLLGVSLPGIESPIAHLKALAACLTKNTITLRCIAACGQSVSSAAQYCAQSNRVAVDTMSLMMMTVCALRIAGRHWEDVPPGTLEDAMLNVKQPRSYWTELPADAECVVLAGRVEPYRLQLHPVVKETAAARRLPEGCSLCTVCLVGGENKRGVASNKVGITLQYEKQDAVQEQYTLDVGEHILLDAMQDAAGKMWALRIRAGSDGWESKVNGMADSAECGTIYLRAGLPDASQCLVDWLREDYLTAEWGQPVVNVAIRECEVLLHMADGTVYSSYSSRGQPTKILFLEDVPNEEAG